MTTADYLSILVHQIHSTVVATVDDEGLPVTCAIDMMDCDENSLYFLTAKGKSLYSRLTTRGYLALTGMKGEDTMSCVALSLRGKVRELGPALLPRLFEKNPYMADIYPKEESRSALTVFQLYEGTGEWIDLSKLPIERADFSFGGAKIHPEGYFITEACTGCGLCVARCPRACINGGEIPAKIRQENCIRCGNCYTVCPAGAIIKQE